MPPNAKFKKDEIISAALEIVEKEGIERLTARSLGAKLGSSARPIFTIFKGMDEVQQEVYAAVQNIYSRYVEEGLKQKIAFKGVGESYVKFAGEHPNLFKLLFMRELSDIPHINSVLYVIENNYTKILNSIICSYGLSERRANGLYEHMWIYTHGIAVLIVTGMCTFTPAQVSDMLTEVFKSLLIKLKSEAEND